MEHNQEVDAVPRDPVVAGQDTGGQRARQGSIGWTGLLFAVLLGTWVGHAVEYYRVWGSAEFASSTARAAHAYFGPIGLVLIPVAAGFIYASMALARRLRRRLDQLGAELLGAAAPTSAPGTASAELPLGRWTPSFPTLWVTLWIGQLILYIIQENLEARVAGTTLPGLGAITGIHAWAPVVHLMVAGLGASVVWLTRRHLAALASEVRQAVQWLARRWRRPVPLTGRPADCPVWTPGQRWGLTLWARPPPYLSA